MIENIISSQDISVIDSLCQTLSNQGDYETLYHLVQTNKKIGHICQKYLSYLKQPTLLERVKKYDWDQIFNDIIGQFIWDYLVDQTLYEVLHNSHVTMTAQYDITNMNLDDFYVDGDELIRAINNNGPEFVINLYDISDDHRQLRAILRSELNHATGQLFFRTYEMVGGHEKLIKEDIVDRN